MGDGCPLPASYAYANITYCNDTWQYAYYAVFMQSETGRNQVF